MPDAFAAFGAQADQFDRMPFLSKFANSAAGMGLAK